MDNLEITSLNNKKMSKLKYNIIINIIADWLFEEWKNDFYLDNIINKDDMIKYIKKMPKDTLFIMHYNFQIIVGMYSIVNNNFPFYYIPRHELSRVSLLLTDHKWLANIYVNELYRGKGCSKKLMDHAIDKFGCLITWCKIEQIDLFSKYLTTNTLYYNCRIVLFNLYKA